MEGNSSKWISEYNGNIAELNNEAIHLCNEIRKFLKSEKVIVTYRVKSPESLSEKIKRNDLDSDHNASKNIFQVLDDPIGIRIVCMKISDEPQIYELIRASKSNFIAGAFLNQSFDVQPVAQKNKHKIYKFYGRFKKYSFEIQIKSLANLYWGEMEHLLVYKNSKCILLSDFYKAEVESIYHELEIIDAKLCRLQKYMINEDIVSRIEEIKDIGKRALYLRYRDSLNDFFDGEELNNNYIYKTVMNRIIKVIPSIIHLSDEPEGIIGRKGKSKPKPNSNEKNSTFTEYIDEQNRILAALMSYLLEKRIDDFDFKSLYGPPLKLNNYKDKCQEIISTRIKELLLTKKTGWGFYYLLQSVIDYVISSEYTVDGKHDIDKISPFIQKLHDDTVTTLSELNISNLVVTYSSEPLKQSCVKMGVERFINTVLVPRCCRMNLDLLETQRVRQIGSDLKILFDYVCRIEKHEKLKQSDLIGTIVDIVWIKDSSDAITVIVMKFLEILKSTDAEYPVGFPSKNIAKYKNGRDKITKCQLFEIINEAVGDVNED